MKRLNLDEIKDIELSLLIEFDKLCKKNGLYYTLCGGTLLGAVRHRGFIPWDDDIDVLMPRPDYDRLLNNLDIDRRTLPKHMEFVSWKDGSSNFPFIKLMDNRTKVVVDYLSPDLGGKHIWIDIFPIDGNPSDERELAKLYRKMAFMRRILCVKLAQENQGKTVVKRMMKPFLIRCFKWISLSWLCKKMDCLAKSYNFEESEYVGGIIWGYGPQERIDKEKYMRGISVEFEGEEFTAPSNYEEYLTGLYQDYMEIPPKEKQKIHGIHAYM